MKKIISIALVIVFALVLACSAIAAASTVQATLTYRDIKVVLDGKKVDLVDAAGNPVEPFIINGTTYLPLRAVSNALGLEVGWDGATSTVSLSKPDLVVDGEILFDNEYATVTLKSKPYKADYSGDYKHYFIDACIYNKTDGMLCLIAGNGAVNNSMNMVMVKGSAVVNPGAKSEISFWFEDENINDASEIKSVQFKLTGQNPDTYEVYFKTGFLNLEY